MKMDVIRAKKKDELTSKNFLEMSTNKLMKLYFEEMIDKGCQDITHKRITTDSTKMRHFELSERLKLLEVRLQEQAEVLGIDVQAMRESIIDANTKKKKKKKNLNAQGSGK